MTKFILALFIFLLLASPAISFAQGICSGPFVECGNEIKCTKNATTGESECTGQCTIKDAFAMIGKIYNFIVVCLASPLAILAIIIGSIFMLVSAGNPQLFNTGKTILVSAIIGLVLAYCSYLIVQTILNILGYSGPAPGNLN